MADALPLEFHVVRVPELSLHVDDDVRREVERWLKHEEGPTLDIVTLYGEDVTLVRGFVFNIFSTTPETRRRDREHGKMIKGEVPVEERE